MSEGLKVTGITKLPSTYKGEPCIMTIEIEDIEGGMYESFKMCDAQAKSVNVKSFRIKHKTNGE